MEPVLFPLGWNRQLHILKLRAGNRCELCLASDKLSPFFLNGNREDTRLINLKLLCPKCFTGQAKIREVTK